MIVSLNCEHTETCYFFPSRLVLPALKTVIHLFEMGIFCGVIETEHPSVIMGMLETVRPIRKSQAHPKVFALVEL